MGKFQRFLCNVAIILCLEPAPALADPPSINPGQDIDAQAERFRAMYILEKEISRSKKIKSMIDIQEQKSPPVESSVVFVLKEIKVTGMSVMDVDHIAYRWQSFIGQQVTFNDLQVIVEKIKEVYKTLGFLTTNVYIPAQDIKNGIVEIKVIEGKLGDVAIEGNKYTSEKEVRKYVHGWTNLPFNVHNLEKDIARMNEYPDFNVNAVLSTGKKPETSDVTLKVKEQLPYHATVGLDNHGTRLTGRWRRTAMLSATNLSGRHDGLYLNTISSNRAYGQYVAYRLPIGTNGFKIGMDVGYFGSKLGEEYKSYDVVGNTMTYNPNASWEVYRSQKFQANARAGLRVKDINKKTGMLKTTDEHFRNPYLALDLNKQDNYGQTNFTPEVSMGTKRFLGSTGRNNPLASRRNTGGFFTKYNQSFYRMQRMPWLSFLEVKSSFQMASRTLPSSEQIQLGGSSSVRGYPEGDFLADMGGDMNFDWVFPMYLLPEYLKLRGSDVSLRDQIQPVVFCDFGGGHLNKATLGEVRNKFLASVGVGLRFRVSKYSYLKMEWAERVGNKAISGTGPSTFGISMQVGT